MCENQEIDSGVVQIDSVDYQLKINSNDHHLKGDSQLKINSGADQTDIESDSQKNSSSR